jgi:hypothetical protein
MHFGGEWGDILAYTSNNLTLSDQSELTLSPAQRLCKWAGR